MKGCTPHVSVNCAIKHPSPHGQMPWTNLNAWRRTQDRICAAVRPVVVWMNCGVWRDIDVGSVGVVRCMECLIACRR